MQELTARQFNAKLIGNAEERMKSWKDLMAMPYKNRDVEFPDWWKEDVRYFMNEEKHRLKMLVEEQKFTYEDR